ncbi:MAG: hypothetical protein ACE5F1_20125, partial [Planctomycetota bacterium]
MTLLPVLWVYLTQVLAGWLLLGTFCGSEERPAAIGKLARALLVGPAAITFQLYLYDLFSVPFGLVQCLAPWWALAAWLLWRRPFLPRLQKPGSRIEWTVAGIFVALFLANLCFGLMLPVIHSDAIENFALNARVFETHGSLAPEALLGLCNPKHIEYPPLVALNEMLCFQAGGLERARVIRPFFSLAYLAFLFLVVELCFARLRPTLASATALLIGMCPIYWDFGENGYADLRLTAALLMAILEGRRLLSRPSEASAFRFALFAAICANTKNEGIALAAAAVIVLASLLSSKRLAVKPCLRAAFVLAFLAGFWPLYKHVHGIGDPFLSAALEQDLIGNLKRVPAILSRFLALTLNTNKHGVFSWGLLWPVTALLSLAALAFGRDRRKPGFLLGCL